MNKASTEIIDKAIMDVRKFQQKKTTQAIIDCLLERHPDMATAIDTKALWEASRQSIIDQPRGHKNHVC
jgi:hypothetical protein